MLRLSAAFLNNNSNINCSNINNSGLLTGTTINATTALQEGGTALTSKYLKLDGTNTMSGSLNTTNIYTTGNSGIGTNTAYSVGTKLTIKGTSTGSTQPIVRIEQTSAWDGNYCLQTVGYSDFGGIRINGADISNTIYTTGNNDMGISTITGVIKFLTNNGFERMRIDTLGYVNIGTTGQAYKLYVNGTSYLNGATTVNSSLAVNGDLTVQDGNSIRFGSGGADGRIYRTGGQVYIEADDYIYFKSIFGGANAYFNQGTLYAPSSLLCDGSLSVGTTAKIGGSLNIGGTLQVGTTANIGGTLTVNGNLTANSIYCKCLSVSSTNTDYIGIQTNRVNIGDNSFEYLVALFGTFTGFHRCFIEDKLFNKDEAQKFKEDYVGRIVIATGKIATDLTNEKNEWEIFYNKEAITNEDAVPMVELSRKKKDKRVFGVLGNPTRRNSRPERLIVDSVGEGGIWVCNSNGNFENGDLKTSSDYLGYGEKQDEIYLCNFTVAKATMDCNFELDSPLYNCIELLDLNIKIAFIACTYHCG